MAQTKKQRVPAGFKRCDYCGGIVPEDSPCYAALTDRVPESGD